MRTVGGCALDILSNHIPYWRMGSIRAAGHAAPSSLMAGASGAQIASMTLLTEGFGRRLRELRLGAGETQHALAIAVGVREQGVRR